MTFFAESVEDFSELDELIDGEGAGEAAGAGV